MNTIQDGFIVTYSLLLYSFSFLILKEMKTYLWVPKSIIREGIFHSIDHMGEGHSMFRAGRRPIC